MRKLIGDKQFYRMVLLVAVPIMIQNGITNFVGLLDNIMVGQVGTAQMSGVAIVNQLMFVYNLCIFGAISGAGIFGAQFYGSGNDQGLRDTFRFKVLVCILLLALGILIFLAFGESLIRLYINTDADPLDAARTLASGKEYLQIMLVGFLPFTIAQMYASTLRETGETFKPMQAGLLAVVINVILNYILIFGKFGFPVMGVQGAALATVISRFAEGAFVLIWTHCHPKQNRFVVGAYRSFRIPMHLVKQIIRKGMPLLVNEALWSVGVAVLMQCYSVRGLTVVAGLNISNTITNIFNVVFIAMGSAVAIIVGQLLGAGKLQEAKETAGKLIFFSVACCVVIGLVMALCSPFFPKLYNTTEEVRSLAQKLILIAALYMPMHAFMHAAYFTLRSGGKTIITFIFDSFYMWMVSIPLAYCLSRFTGMSILWMYLCCQMIDIFKCILGFVLVRKGAWLQNIVVDHNVCE